MFYTCSVNEMIYRIIFPIENYTDEFVSEVYYSLDGQSYFSAQNLSFCIVTIGYLP